MPKIHSVLSKREQEIESNVGKLILFLQKPQQSVLLTALSRMPVDQRRESLEKAARSLPPTWPQLTKQMISELLSGSQTLGS